MAMAIFLMDKNLVNGHQMDFKIKYMGYPVGMDNIDAVTGIVLKNVMFLYPCTYYDKYN